jgi:glucosyl-3-phosphoglycerate synthase
MHARRVRKCRFGTHHPHKVQHVSNTAPDGPAGLTDRAPSPRVQPSARGTEAARPEPSTSRTPSTSNATSIERGDGRTRQAASPRSPLGRTFPRGAFDAADLARRKGATSVSVVIPARNEEATVGSIVSSIRRALGVEAGGVGLVDEVIVVDDDSTDATAAVAGSAGATVVRGPGAGKGGALAVGVGAARGELVCFLDADVANFDPSFVVALLGPLLTDPAILLVKAFYERPLAGQAGEGGRVTELVARPAIELLAPELAWVRQPLAGETALRRWVLDHVRLASGYGVELKLLLDVASRFGTEAIAQVDLGERVHRNRPLADLVPQAKEVLAVALQHVGLLDASSTDTDCIAARAVPSAQP